MIKTISILFFLLFCATFSAKAQSVEDKVMQELRQSFTNSGLSLESLNEQYATILKKESLLEENTTKAWKTLLRKTSSKGVIGHVAPDNFEVLNLEFQLSLQHLNTAIEKVMSEDSSAFVSSDIGQFVSRFPQPDNDKQTALVYLLNTIEDAEDDLKAHPLFKQLLVLTEANFATILNYSSDKLINSESDYARLRRANGGTFPMVEQRNIFLIQVNNEGEIKARGNSVSNVLEIQPILREFFTMNRGLNLSETAKLIADHTYEGYNLPFFSQISGDEIDENIKNLSQQIDSLHNLAQANRSLLFARELWIHKRQLQIVSQKEVLKEIHHQSHIRVDAEDISDQLADQLFAAILGVISDLRNEEAMRVFGESFDEIVARRNFYRNDHIKLRYLENQFPLYVLVNPKRFMSPPPADSELLPPPK